MTVQDAIQPVKKRSKSTNLMQRTSGDNMFSRKENISPEKNLMFYDAKKNGQLNLGKKKTNPAVKNAHRSYNFVHFEPESEQLAKADLHLGSMASPIELPKSRPKRP